MHYDKARRMMASRVRRVRRHAALAWLETVGAWPTSDPDVAALTRKAHQILGWQS